MELSKLIRPLSKRQKELTKKDLLKTINIALKISTTLSDMSYGQMSATEFALGVNISSKAIILHMKRDIEELGFAQTPSVNEYQNFVTKAFKENKLFFTCKDPKIDDNYAIDKKRVKVDVTQDPRLFNPKDQTGIRFKLQFPIIPLTPKAKKVMESNNQKDQINYVSNPTHTPYKG